ncbi:MAG: DASS family sodium-coupled anion symporter, partial [Bacteroidota bacterium]
GRFPDDDAPTRFGLVLMLAIAYACSIGGLGTLIGTPTNALLAAFMSETYQIEIGFAQWMLVGVPLVVVGLTVSFVVLTRFVHPLGKTELPGGAAYVREELNTLGGMSRDESWIAGVFAVTAVLWMTRPLLSGVVPGLSDTGIAIGAGVLLFALPSSQGGRLLDWETARRLPWGVLLLFGGGLSLAAAIKNSGLAVWIGTQLAGLDTWPPVLLVLLVLVVVILLTELTSNTATAAAFLPVLAGLADVLGTTPLQLLVPATLAASCAFMLPVATPPNAIVYGSGQVTITQMARAGVWLNLAFVGLVLALTFTLVPAVF